MVQSIVQPVEESQEPTRTEELFAEFLAQHHEGLSPDFEALCRQHAEQEPHLRRLHSAWLRVAGMLGRAAFLDPATGREQSSDGPDNDPGVSLDSDADSQDDGSQGELVERLASHSPRHTRYKLRNEIARGGMGVVLRVWDQDLRRNLAMKIVLDRSGQARRNGKTHPKAPKATIDSRVLSRFLEEAQITAQLEHPGIVPVHELGLDARGRVYFTMPLVRGRDFKQIIRLARDGADGWTLARSLGVLLKVCEAVAFAHSKGVVHRDLKPANIMVGRFGETYVMDWGLARVLGRPDSHDLRLAPGATLGPAHGGETNGSNGSRARGTPRAVDGAHDDISVVHTDRHRAHEYSPGSPLVTKYGDVIGTPSYMSPEQARGLVEEIGPPSDVYSIGAILYQLLTGRPAYMSRRSGLRSGLLLGIGTRPTPESILAAVLKGPPPPVLELAPSAQVELAEICEKAMARDPAQRYAGALDMARDIEAFLDRRPIAAREPSVAYAARLFYERHKRGVLAATAGLLLFAGVATGLALRGSEARSRASQLADARAVRVLIEEADELPAPLPSNAPALELWLGRVDELLLRGDRYRVALAGPAELGRDVAPPPTGEREQLLAKLSELKRLRLGVLERFELARLLADPAFQGQGAAWDRFRADIAMPDSEYESVTAALSRGDVPGLVPLQKNPQSGLWEFWCVASGDRPVPSDAADGSYALTAESGIVLVLLPGGTVELGSPDEELGHQEEEVLHQAQLEPFFLSKFEITQAQWAPVMGSTPSAVHGGMTLKGSKFSNRPDLKISTLHPVESVNWFECAEFARRLGLALPTEWQWEYACRAGTDTAWSFGGRWEYFEGAENIKDASHLVTEDGSLPEGFSLWDDGYFFHAPVGTFRPNGFGLFDMHGNVAEWCENDFREDPASSEPSRLKAIRGGKWNESPFEARSAFRMRGMPRSLNHALGTRVSLAPAWSAVP